MLAFKTGLPTAYDPALTLASLLIAISVTAAGFLVAGQGRSALLPAMGGAAGLSHHRNGDLKWRSRDRFDCARRALCHGSARQLSPALARPSAGLRPAC
jgi:Bacterial signalling protein N terminal repeat